MSSCENTYFSVLHLLLLLELATPPKTINSFAAARIQLTRNKQVIAFSSVASETTTHCGIEMRILLLLFFIITTNSWKLI